jgi:hypothetical protein
LLVEQAVPPEARLVIRISTILLALAAFNGGLGQERELFNSAHATPLPAEMAKALKNIPFDPAPPKLIFNTHYVTSNELRHHVYKPHLATRGGIYIGVGSDQNYLLAAWQKPDLLLVVDFDLVVVDLHRVYRILFANSQTPAQLMAFWSRLGIKKAVRLIEAATPSRSLKKRLLWTYRYSRKKVEKRLGQTVRLYKKRNVSTFLSDQQQFETIKRLFAEGRVVAYRGDYTGYRTIKGIGAFARRFKLPVNVLYLSNVEYYFDYAKDRFRQNMAELPFGNESAVLHTIPVSRDTYTYSLVKGPTYQAWLRCCCIKKASWFLRYGKKQPLEHFIIVEQNPQAFAKSAGRARGLRKRLEREIARKPYCLRKTRRRRK